MFHIQIVRIGILDLADHAGFVKISDIIAYFRSYYESRCADGLMFEKANSIYTDKEAELNIIVNPFKRFEDMNMFRRKKKHSARSRLILRYGKS